MNVTVANRDNLGKANSWLATADADGFRPGIGRDGREALDSFVRSNLVALGVPGFEVLLDGNAGVGPDQPYATMAPDCRTCTGPTFAEAVEAFYYANNQRLGVDNTTFDDPFDASNPVRTGNLPMTWDPRLASYRRLK